MKKNFIMTNKLPFNNVCQKENRGFTLAEVLITLVIVGIIAAITVPSLMNKLERNELRSQFNKAVRVSSEAVQRMKLDYGDIVYDNNEDTVTIFRDRFMSYFSVICKDNCVDNSKYKNFANLNDGAIYFITRCFIVQDGMSYCVHKGGTTNIYITIDVNGPNKKPNRWGYDTFTFYVPFKNQVLKPCNIDIPTGDMKCNSMGTSYNGAGCTAKALADPNYFKNLH